MKTVWTIKDPVNGGFYSSNDERTWENGFGGLRVDDPKELAEHAMRLASWGIPFVVTKVDLYPTLIPDPAKLSERVCALQKFPELSWWVDGCKWSSDISQVSYATYPEILERMSRGSGYVHGESGLIIRQIYIAER